MLSMPCDSRTRCDVNLMTVSRKHFKLGAFCYKQKGSKISESCTTSQSNVQLKDSRGSCFGKRNTESCDSVIDFAVYHG